MTKENAGTEDNDATESPRERRAAKAQDRAVYVGDVGDIGDVARIDETAPSAHTMWI